MTISQKDYGKEFKRALPIYCLFQGEKVHMWQIARSMLWVRAIVRDP